MSGERILVITPSRGRPGRLTAMLDATLSTSGPGTHVAVGYDEDDPDLAGYEQLSRDARELWPGRTFWHRGPRRSLAGWTNYIAGWPRAVRYPYLASFGDDHMPKTDGWDEALASSLERWWNGTGIAYGDDGHQHENLPTAPVISSDIVRVLGWVVLPGIVSKFCDNAWRDLGMLAGCLSYVPEAKIIHEHPDAGKAGWDATYAEGHGNWAADEQSYLAWGRSPGDGKPSQRDLDVRAVQSAIRLRAAAAAGALT